jgi:crossover junction endodeoxyribonuclease RuvC
MPRPDLPSIVLGIDPGLDGAIAALNPAGEVVAARPMPVLAGRRREIDAGWIVGWLYRIEETEGGFALAVVEKVHAMPKQGVSSSFAFGLGYGQVLGVLAALKVPVVLVTPQQWKGAILAGTAKDKAAAIAYCRRRWPEVSLVPDRCRTPHDGLADALCLAEFARRQLVGEDRTRHAS